MSVILGFTKLPDRQWSDEMLAARIAQGDVAALEILYDRYAPMVLGIAFKIVGERAAAENVLQETFWRVWKSPITPQPEQGSFTSWLFRMARMLALDACQQSHHS
jgi:RNA polymerase sigma-70 factor, ECF subfamily